MSDFELINKAAHRIYPTHLTEHEKGSSFSWSGVLPTDAKSRLVKDSEGHKQTDDRNSHTLTHKLKGGASIEFNIVQNGKNHIAMAKYHKGGKLFTAIHAHEDPSKAIKTAYDSVARRIVTEEAEIALIEKMEKRIEKKTGKLSDKKEKIDVEPSEEKELKEGVGKGGPNKTIARARKAMGGFPARSYKPDEFIDWVADQARQGRRFKDTATAKAEFEKSTIGEKQLKEATPPGMESWVKKNKAHFVKEYGEKKGHEVLYATAWKLHNKMNEMEELNELSKKTLASYIKQASHHARRNEYYAGRDHGKNQQESDKELEVSRKRQKGIEKAADKLAEAHTYTKEGLAKQIKYHENNEEELNELSKKTLASYVKKSNHSSFELGYDAAYNEFHDDGDYKKTQKDEKKALKRQRFVNKAIDKLAEAHTYTKEGLAKQIKYHENRAAHHDSEAQVSFNKAQDLTGDKADLHFNAAKGHKAIADLHRKHIYDLKSSAGLTEAEGKVEMMYLSKGFISPELAEKLARESKHLGTDKSTGEQHYLHPRHGRMALVPHKPSGQFQFRLAEEIEQLDELSPHALSIYTRLSAIDKSKHAGMGTVARTAQYRAEHAKDKKTAKEEKERADFHQKKEDKRLNGIIQATSKLARKAYGLHEASRPAPHPDNESLIDEPHHANSAKIVQNHPELNRIFNKQEALGNKLTVFRSDNGLHLYSYEAPNIKNRSKIYHSFIHDDNTGKSSEVARESGHEHSIHAAWKRYKKHLNEDLDHDHPDMKAYHAACKARDEAHLASIRYRMNHDIKQPEHRAKYDELEAEHHRLRDIEDAASEKVNGRLFAHHAAKK